MNEAELYIAENSKNTNRVKFYKKRLKDLGAIEKTYFTPFKHRLNVNLKKKEKKKKMKEERLNLGLLHRKKKK